MTARHSARRPFPPSALGPVTDPRLLDLGAPLDDEVDDVEPPVDPRSARVVLLAEEFARHASEHASRVHQRRVREGFILAVSLTALIGTVCVAVLLH